MLPKRHAHRRYALSDQPDRSFRQSAVRTGDCGLTGRKIIVDTCGGAAHQRRRRGSRPGSVEGGLPAGSRPLRGEEHRRHGLADKCEVQVAYAIGVARPVT